MRQLLQFLSRKKQRNTSSPQMLNNAFLHLSRDEKSKRAIKAASKRVKHGVRPDIKAQDLARLHKEK